MDNDNDNANANANSPGGVSPHSNGKDNTWLSNKFNGPIVSEEETPLLSDGSNGGDISREHQWEGAADFVDQPWWNTPSVSYDPFFG